MTVTDDSLSGEQLPEFLSAAQEAARLAGAILQDWSTRFTAREKSRSNLVTEADEAAQLAIFERLHSRFPEHRFLGEEGLNHDAGNSPCRWVIDPLDGTTNYVHRFPYYAVSIGLEVGGKLAVGVIYDPSRDEMFSATAGGGATLNEQPLRTSAIRNLPSALCLAGLPAGVDRNHPSLRAMIAVTEAARSVHRTGSAALNLCSVAAGRAEAFFSRNLHAWDVAAGVLIVREAGGRVTRTDGGEFSIHTPDLLASNGQLLHEELIAVIRHEFAGDT